MKRLILIALVVLVGSRLVCQVNKKVNFGIYTGYGWGLNNDFIINEESMFEYEGVEYISVWKDQTEWILGAYFQLNLSAKWSLQLDINYQRLFPQSGFQTRQGDSSSEPELSGDVRHRNMTFFIHSVHHFKQKRRIQLFLKWGLGPAFRNAYFLQQGENKENETRFYLMGFHYAYFNLQVGPGLRIYLGEPNRSTALITGVMVQYLYRKSQPVLNGYPRMGGLLMQFYLGIEE